MNYRPSDTRYDSMKYNQCGRSGLKLPAISLGLWQNFGGVDTPANSREMILRAFDLGITHFDTANNYGIPPGSAEETLGTILRKDLAGYRDELVISTKAGHVMWPGPYGEWNSRKHLIASLDQSLKRMGTDYVDIFYSHRPDLETPMEETMAALNHAVRQGKALYVGISAYSVEQTVEASRILKQLGTACLIHQPSYSILDRWIEDGLLDLLEAEGIGCIVYWSLYQGLLTGRYLNGIPEGSRAARALSCLTPEHVNEEAVAKARKWKEIAEERGQSLAQMALAWVLRDPRVTSTIVGASSPKQVEENVVALSNVEFTADELARIDAVMAG